MQCDTVAWRDAAYLESLAINMSLPDTAVLDVPSLLSAGSMMVAIVAAVYASRQVAAAKAALAESRMQNRISMHREQLEIYSAFITFRGKLRGHGVHFKNEELWPLWDKVELAEFYFPKNLADGLNGVVAGALEVEASRALWSDVEGISSADRKRYSDATYEQHKQLVGKIDALDPQLRAVLRLVDG